MSDIKVKVNPQNLTSIRVGQQNTTKVLSSTTGLQGIVGLQGRQGTQGLQGLQGLTGSTGGNAGRIFYFAKQSSDINGYYKALESPSTSGLSSTTVQLTQVGVPVLIDKFVTEPNSPGVLSIPVGENVITIHTNIVSSQYYVHTIQYNAIILKCNSDGTGISTITSALSEQFSGTNLEEFIWNVTSQYATSVNITDRIIFEFYAILISTTSNAPPPGQSSSATVNVYYEDQVQGFIRTSISAGAIGPQGVQGVQGTQGVQGLIGPVAGSNTQVLFNNNNVSAGATNFVYDATNLRVGIGTTNPTSTLSVIGTALITGISTVGIGTTSTPPSNSQMSFELTSDTNLRIKVRGSDGVLRSGNITLS
jgi:hypothetical protein